ncbi:hypothetical protein CHARACLAT_032739 [Characodon lateralis]|uniref:Uncharacterized protein n=1 Tax=Characodon lateralis TaxID=208331 RepID=A0ABU7F801_9TELE|nr:hypothetical protein [Characodon lateralis]
MLKDVAGSRSLSTVSPDSVTSVTCAQCEPAFICEEHRAPVANLPILVFSGKCKRPTPCWAVSITPICGHLAIIPSSWSRFLSVCADTCTFVACWRSFCRAWRCSSCSSLHIGGGSGPAPGLLPSYGLLHVSWCTGLSPGSASRP